MNAIAAYLAEDHVRLGTLLAQATALPGRIDAAPFSAFRGGLLRHIGMEEKLLFPALKRLLGAPHPAVARLHKDHGAIASLLVPTPTALIVSALRAVLEPHDALEESGDDGLYAAAAQLPAAEAEALLTAMKAVREPPQSPHNDSPAAFRQIAHTMAAANIDHPVPSPDADLLT